MEEKNWIVECWGYVDAGETTLFETEDEAKGYFEGLKRKLDSEKYRFEETRIVEVEDETNAIYLTNLDELV